MGRVRKAGEPETGEEYYKIMASKYGIAIVIMNTH